MAWTDVAGSANGPQNNARLVNDLDVTLISPTGGRWHGNVFANGFSITGGTADTVNNVERIRIDAGTLPDVSEGWTVQIDHKEGSSQRFGLVVTAVASVSYTHLTLPTIYSV